MGIYENDSQKKLEIKKELIKLQPIIEEIEGIVTDHGYVELQPLVEKLDEIYRQLELINNMGVGFK